MPFFNCHCEPLPLHGACPERYEILPLPLRYTQRQGQNDKKRRVQGQGDRMGVIATLFIVIASEAWQSEEKRNSKIKG